MTVGWFFVAYGEPAPAGSKTPGRPLPNGGRIPMRESSKKVSPWRQDVMAAAVTAVETGAPRLDGPLAVTLIFTLRRPVGARKMDRAPSRKPDLDKLVRSTFDAITLAGLWADDARVARLQAGKVWAGYSPDALIAPGVRAVCVPMYTPDVNATLEHDELLAACLAAHPAPDLVDLTATRQRAAAPAAQGALL